MSEARTAAVVKLTNSGWSPSCNDESQLKKKKERDNEPRPKLLYFHLPGHSDHHKHKVLKNTVELDKR